MNSLKYMHLHSLHPAYFLEALFTMTEGYPAVSTLLMADEYSYFDSIPSWWKFMQEYYQISAPKFCTNVTRMRIQQAAKNPGSNICA